VKEQSVEELVVGLLLWLNLHGFPACTGEPEIHRASGNQAHGYVAWYQDGVIDLSERFDYDGLLLEPTTQRAKLTRSTLLHELARRGASTIELRGARASPSRAGMRAAEGGGTARIRRLLFHR